MSPVLKDTRNVVVTKSCFESHDLCARPLRVWQCVKTAILVADLYKYFCSSDASTLTSPSSHGWMALPTLGSGFSRKQASRSKDASEERRYCGHGAVGRSSEFERCCSPA